MSKGVFRARRPKKTGVDLAVVEELPTFFADRSVDHLEIGLQVLVCNLDTLEQRLKCRAHELDVGFLIEQADGKEDLGDVDQVFLVHQLVLRAELFFNLRQLLKGHPKEVVLERAPLVTELGNTGVVRRLLVPDNVQK